MFLGIILGETLDICWRINVLVYVSLYFSLQDFHVSPGEAVCFNRKTRRHYQHFSSPVFYVLVTCLTNFGPLWRVVVQHWLYCIIYVCMLSHFYPFGVFIFAINTFVIFFSNLFGLWLTNPPLFLTIFNFGWLATDVCSRVHLQIQNCPIQLFVMGIFLVSCVPTRICLVIHKHTDQLTLQMNEWKSRFACANSTYKTELVIIHKLHTAIS